MADGALTITIPDADAARFMERTGALGVSPETLALTMFSRLVNDRTPSDHPATTDVVVGRIFHSRQNRTAR